MEKIYIDVTIGAVNLISTRFTQKGVIYDEHVSEDGSEPNMWDNAHMTQHL